MSNEPSYFKQPVEDPLDRKMNAKKDALQKPGTQRDVNNNAAYGNFNGLGPRSVTSSAQPQLRDNNDNNNNNNPSSFKAYNATSPYIGGKIEQPSKVAPNSGSSPTPRPLSATRTSTNTGTSAAPPIISQTLVTADAYVKIDQKISEVEDLMNQIRELTVYVKNARDDAAKTLEAGNKLAVDMADPEKTPVAQMVVELFALGPLKPNDALKNVLNIFHPYLKLFVAELKSRPVEFVYDATSSKIVIPTSTKFNTGIDGVTVASPFIYPTDPIARVADATDGRQVELIGFLPLEFARDNTIKVDYPTVWQGAPNVLDILSTAIPVWRFTGDKVPDELKMFVVWNQQKEEERIAGDSWAAESLGDRIKEILTSINLMLKNDKNAGTAGTIVPLVLNKRVFDQS